ncbi:MAG: ferritin-like domain-containing protein [Polyangiales bacterium]
MSASTQPAQSIKSPMEISWQFSYEMDNQQLKTLYSKAKRLQWDAETQIDWTQPIDPSRPLIDEERFGLSQLPFVRRMDKSKQEALRAHIAAYQLSQFLHGEQGALMTAAALTHAVPDYEGKLYAATQTMDEARHVEVYDRYIKKLAIIYPMSEVLKAVIDKTLQADRWVKIAIGMNMVVEGLALGAFQNMRRSTTCPLLREIVEGVLRDEARHVAFGNVYVKQAVAQMHPDEREDVADFAFEAIAAMRGRSGGVARGQGGFDPGFVQVLEVVGIEPMEFMAGVMEARQQGVRVEPPADQVHAFRDLMMPALVRVGVVTERVRERYAEAGIKIYEDQTVLRAMEQG